MTVLGLGVVLLLALARGIRAACWKHSTCGDCISEVFHGGSCLWYEQPTANHSAAWSCVAGMVGPSRHIEEAAKIVGSSRWSSLVEDGLEADFTVLHVDTLSENSCYLPKCQMGGTCSLGYYAVENRPCYPDGVHPEWREVRCCRQQRNSDGYLRGINEEGGVVKGRLFYSSCCRPCPPGHVNVGCASYNPGECELCAAGTFNPSVEVGSTCSKCMPCPAGQRRVNCGPSSPGRCEDCMPGRFKTQGLEGDAQDECLKCSTARCPNAAERTGCGLADAGHCESCPQGSYYAQPFCRDCSVCGSFRRDVGCGGRADSTCTECRSGQYLAQDGKCTPCASCADQLDSTSAVGFDVRGSMVRVGCGASAPGECVRLGALLDREGLNAQCPAVQFPDALCPGTSLKLRWAIEGNTASAPKLAVGGSDCTSTDGVCLTGSWRAALWKRTVEQTAGVEVQMLGEWQLEDVDAFPVVEVNGTRHLFYLKSANLHALASDLEGGSGYFVRLSFIDYGKTCCVGSVSSPLTVDTLDFDIGRPMAPVETSLYQAEVSMQNGDWRAAYTTLFVACTAASGSNIACERARALQMGVATDLAFRPLPLPPVVIAPALQSKQAASPVDDMRSVLAVWEDLTLRAFNSTARGNATANRSDKLVDTASEGSAAARMSAADFNKLADIATEVSAAANATMNLWQQELDDSLQSLTRALTDLKDVNSRLDNAAWTIGFDVIRMAQSITKSLQQTLAAGPPAEESSRIAWYATSLHCIGNVALMMLGTWRGDWRHTLPWQVVAEVGVASAGDLASETSFGGVTAGPDRVPLKDARGRVWQPFRQVAEAWMSQLAADIAAANSTSTRLRRVAENSPAETAADVSGMPTIRKLGESLSNPRRASGSSSMRLQDLAGAIDEINGFMAFIEDVTEKLMDPLSQAGSQLLAGELPDILGCGPKLRCISTYVSTLSHKLAVDVAMHGLGPRSQRPWIDPHVDKLRQRRAATEIISLMQGRALLFEGLLLQMLDVRYTRSEPHDLAEQAERAKTAAKQFSILGDQDTSASALRSNGTQLTWRWRHGWSELQESLDKSWRSAIHLTRRKLGQLEQLVVFTSPVAEENSNSWRIPWRPALASTLHISEAAAIGELESSLSQIWARRGEAAYLRIEANTETWPTALSSLARNGETLLRLEAPPGMHGVLMHTKAHAFLLSQRVYGSQALQPVESENTAAQSPINLTVREPHIELQLRHIGSGAGELPHAAAPFITRHKRSKCAPLGDDAALKEDSYGDAALRPLYGTWLLSARDGMSLEQLAFDEGTTIRLLIKVDIPGGRPPWQLVRGIHDALYLMSADDDCDSLVPLFGYQAQTTTMNPVRATTTTTAASMMITFEQPVRNSTPSLGDTADPSVEPEQQIQRPGGFMTTKAPSEASSEAFASFLWTLPVIGLAGICLCCLLVYARFRHSLLVFLQRKMPWLVRRKKSLVTASDATFDSPSPKGAEKLRYRLPSPKAHESPPLPSQVSMSPGQLDLLRVSAANCERLAPRSSAQRGSRKGARGSGHRDDSDGESWGDAAETPPGSSDESSSSGSSTSRSSSSLSSLEPAHPPAFPQSDNRAGKAEEEDTKPLQSTGTGYGEADDGPNNARAALDNNSAGCSNSTGTPRGGARTDSAESPPGASIGHAHSATAAATAATSVSRELAAPPVAAPAAPAAPTAAAASASAAAELDTAESAVVHNTAPGIGGEPAADDPPEMLTRAATADDPPEMLT